MERDLMKLLEKQPRELRTSELAGRINAVARDMADEQRLVPLVEPWHKYMKPDPEKAPEEWQELMDNLDGRDRWSMVHLLDKFVSRYKLTNLGELREFCSKKSLIYGLTQRSLAFGIMAFAKKESEGEQIKLL